MNIYNSTSNDIIVDASFFCAEDRIGSKGKSSPGTSNDAINSARILAGTAKSQIRCVSPCEDTQAPAPTPKCSTREGEGRKLSLNDNDGRGRSSSSSSHRVTKREIWEWMESTTAIANNNNNTGDDTDAFPHHILNTNYPQDGCILPSLHPRGTSKSKRKLTLDDFFIRQPQDAKADKYEEEQKRKARKEKRRKDDEKLLEQMLEQRSAESRAYLISELAKLLVWTHIPRTAAKLDYVEVQIDVDAANITTILSAVCKSEAGGNRFILEDDVYLHTGGHLLQRNYTHMPHYTHPSLRSLFVGWWLIIALAGWFKERRSHGWIKRYDVIGVMKLHDLTGWLKLLK